MTGGELVEVLTQRTVEARVRVPGAWRALAHGETYGRGRRDGRRAARHNGSNKSVTASRRGELAQVLPLVPYAQASSDRLRDVSAGEDRHQRMIDRSPKCVRAVRIYRPVDRSGADGICAPLPSGGWAPSLLDARSRAEHKRAERCSGSG
jgi:hypothetical protein